jgi:hypothetical protein
MTTSRKDDGAFLDGNVLSGPLGEVFTFDVAAAAVRCVSCDRPSRLPDLHVYPGGPGLVARCPGCDEVIARYVRTPSRAFLDLRGTVALSVSMARDR